MTQKNDFTGGRTFWQYTFMDFGKIFTILFLHTVLGYCTYLLITGERLGLIETRAGLYTAWTIVIATLTAFWVGSVADYKNKKKGISR